MKATQQLEDENRAIQAILDNGVEEVLRSIPNVVHVAVGLKEKNVKLLDELCIRVYVKEKLDKSKIPLNEIIPAEFEGIKTDVNVVGEFYFSEDNGRYRPIVGGIQISNRIIGYKDDHTGDEISRGTLGCIAIFNEDKSHVLLSNWHVIMANKASIGDNIYQPAPSSIPKISILELPKKPEDDINAIAKILKYAITNKVDGAVARINECYSICCRCCGVGHKDEIKGLNAGVSPSNSITGKAAAVAGQVVYKVGWKTGRAEGRVVEVNAPSFTLNRAGTSYTFDGQISIQCVDPTQKFSESGDSGSVIINSDNKIIGLLFASGPKTTSGITTYSCAANHINDVESALNISIIFSPGTNHTRGEILDLHASPPLQMEDDTEHLDKIRKKLLEHELTKELYEKVIFYQQEVLDLVYHCRQVTITWHRNQGPAFLAHIIQNTKNPFYLIPENVKAITLKILFQNMSEILLQHGSQQLQEELQQYFPLVLESFKAYTSIEEFIDHVVKKGECMPLNKIK